MSNHGSLNNAKKAKNDEFYTQLSDVADELRHYRDHFKGKVIFCNCDDPTWSAFWRYFHLNFEFLGLKKLISTHYDRNVATYKMEYEGGDDNNIEAGVKTPLEGNGDFRNKECLDLLDECDIVVTNPPFSLARAYVAVLEEHHKKYLMIGDLNWVTYKEIFPLIKDNKLWLGYNHVKEFCQPDGTIKKFGNKLWFTNLDITKRHEELILWKPYNPEEYPSYDNYDAINVDKVAEIPKDYCESWELTLDEYNRLSKDEWEVVRHGFREKDTVFVIPAVGTRLRKLLHDHSDGYKEQIEKELGNALYDPGVMGVPITFLDKYNPEQFEIVAFRKCDNGKDLVFARENSNILSYPCTTSIAGMIKKRRRKNQWETYLRKNHNQTEIEPINYVYPNATNLANTLVNNCTIKGKKTYVRVLIRRKRV